MLSGVVDGGGSGVGDEGYILFGEQSEQVWGLLGTVVFVESGGRGGDGVASEEFAGYAGVLGGYKVGLFEDSQCAQGDVFEVAYRSGFPSPDKRPSQSRPGLSHSRGNALLARSFGSNTTRQINVAALTERKLNCLATVISEQFWRMRLPWKS